MLVSAHQSPRPYDRRLLAQSYAATDRFRFGLVLGGRGAISPSSRFPVSHGFHCWPLSGMPTSLSDLVIACPEPSTLTQRLMSPRKECLTSTPLTFSKVERSCSLLAPRLRSR